MKKRVTIEQYSKIIYKILNSVRPIEDKLIDALNESSKYTITYEKRKRQ
jgi:hypothetical protein